MTTMRRGKLPPSRTGGPPVTNIRNTASPHWRVCLKPESRCLVPVNSFAKYAPCLGSINGCDAQVPGDNVAIVTSQLCSFNPLLNDGMQWRHRGNLTSFPYRRSLDVGARGDMKAAASKGAMMAKKAKARTRVPYTKDDVRKLKAHSRARTPLKKIAKEMKRTQGALRQKALHLGIGLGHQR